MPVFLYTFIHWTWGILQNLAASLIFLRYVRCPHRRFHGAVVTEWDKNRYMALGMFIFVKKGCDQRLVVHEYGHTFQSLLLGPLYFLVIGIPSIFWASSKKCQKFRKEKNVPYSKLYCEKWASKWGEKVSKEEADWT